jgi:uncharacterized membrane protein
VKKLVFICDILVNKIKDNKYFILLVIFVILYFSISKYKTQQSF